MKKKFYIIIPVFIVLFITGLIWGCKKEAKLGNAIFITNNTTDPENAVTENITVNDPNSPAATFAVSASASTPLTTNATVNFAPATQLVAAYNVNSIIKYTPMPAGTYTLSQNSAVIKAGSYTSGSITITVTADTKSLTNGPYLLPVTISSVQGTTLPVLQNAKTVYFAINPLSSVTKAVDLTDFNNYFNVNFASDNANLISMNAITYQCRFKMNSFQTTSPFISSVMGVEGTFLLRFGDTSIPDNVLEVTTASGNLIGNTAYKTGEWYYVCVTYDGSTIKLYVNGVLDNSMPYTGAINLATNTNAFYIGSSFGGRYPDGAFNEFRVWSAALSQTDIQNNECSVSPASPGLEAYWRLNEGGGVISTDLTGHGHTATAHSLPTWINGLTCP